MAISRTQWNAGTKWKRPWRPCVRRPSDFRWRTRNRLGNWRRAEGSPNDADWSYTSPCHM